MLYLCADEKGRHPSLPRCYLTSTVFTSENQAQKTNSKQSFVEAAALEKVSVLSGLLFDFWLPSSFVPVFIQQRIAECCGSFPATPCFTFIQTLHTFTPGRCPVKPHSSAARNWRNEVKRALLMWSPLVADMRDNTAHLFSKFTGLTSSASFRYQSSTHYNPLVQYIG